MVYVDTACRSEPGGRWDRCIVHDSGWVVDHARCWRAERGLESSSSSFTSLQDTGYTLREMEQYERGKGA